MSNQCTTCNASALFSVRWHTWSTDSSTNRVVGVWYQSSFLMLFTVFVPIDLWMLTEIYPHLSLSIYPSYLSIYLSVCPSACLSVYPSVSLSLSYHARSLFIELLIYHHLPSSVYRSISEPATYPRTNKINQKLPKSGQSIFSNQTSLFNNPCPHGKLHYYTPHQAIGLLPGSPTHGMLLRDFVQADEPTHRGLGQGQMKRSNDIVWMIFNIIYTTHIHAYYIQCHVHAYGCVIIFEGCSACLSLLVQKKWCSPREL